MSELTESLKFTYKSLIKDLEFSLKVGFTCVVVVCKRYGRMTTPHMIYDILLIPLRGDVEEISRCWIIISTCSLQVEIFYPDILTVSCGLSGGFGNCNFEKDAPSRALSRKSLVL